MNIQVSIFSKLLVSSTLKDEFLSFATFGSSKSVIAEFLLHGIDDSVIISFKY